jgi:hypothetical protein
MRTKHVTKGRCPHCEAMIKHEGEPKAQTQRRRRAVAALLKMHRGGVAALR